MYLLIISHWRLFQDLPSPIKACIADVEELVDLGPGTNPVPLNSLLQQRYGYKHNFLGWVAVILAGESTCCFSKPMTWYGVDSSFTCFSIANKCSLQKLSEHASECSLLSFVNRLSDVHLDAWRESPAGYGLFFAAMAVIGLRFLNFQKRWQLLMCGARRNDLGTFWSTFLAGSIESEIYCTYFRNIDSHDMVP